MLKKAIASIIIPGGLTTALINYLVIKNDLKNPYKLPVGTPSPAVRLEAKENLKKMQKSRTNCKCEVSYFKGGLFKTFRKNVGYNIVCQGDADGYEYITGLETLTKLGKASVKRDGNGLIVDKFKSETSIEQEQLRQHKP